MPLIIHNKWATLAGLANRLDGIRHSLERLYGIDPDTYDEETWEEIRAAEDDCNEAIRHIENVMAKTPRFEE